ncbi:MAG: RagB/SusD family nutrient uptake outer membrane protein [Calditrichaeota bacterium]|nr:RagB/SusD family nutrient uptake outer membrane protein [Calditrichota bacterium]
MKCKYLNLNYILMSLIGILLILIGCSLDVNNPNSASENDVLTTPEGIIALAIGMQEIYATNVVHLQVFTTGVTSREIAGTTTYASVEELDDGGVTLSNANERLARWWSNAYKVVGMAEDLIENTPNVKMDEGTKTGIIALAKLYKAMTIGGLAMGWEKIPLTTDKEGRATFVPNKEAWKYAAQLLDEAIQDINANQISDKFYEEVIASQIDLINTIHAFRARFKLLSGDFNGAIEAANAVDPTVTSMILYDNINSSPFFTDQGNFAPRDSFAIKYPETDKNDKRISFFMKSVDSLSYGDRYPVDEWVGFYKTPTSPVPFYVPGEMTLIKAEAYLNLGDLNKAVDEINKIRTKKPDEDPYGIGADLPPYSGPVTEEALKDEIFRQRAAELFCQGVRLEDARRLGQPGPDANDPFARNRNYYPYPLGERENNPNTPQDPDI